MSNGCIANFLREVQELLTHSVESDGMPVWMCLLLLKWFCSQLCIINHWVIKRGSLWSPYAKHFCLGVSALSAVFLGASVSTCSSSSAFIWEVWVDREMHGYLYISWDKQMRCKEQAMVLLVSKACSVLDTVWLHYVYGIYDSSVLLLI